VLNKNEPDLNSLMKVQDIIDVLYKINRIKDNSYDQNFNRQLNNMPPVDKAQDIIKYISKNSDLMTRQNADILIDILRNVNEVNHNINSNIRSSKNNRNGRNTENIRNSKNSENYKNVSNSKKYSIKSDDNFLDKIKNFLKLLNDE